MDILKHKVVTTKKSHECFFCRRKFPPKTRMTYVVASFSGDLHATYGCETCEGIINIMDTDSDEYDYGYVEEMLKIGQTPEQLLEELNGSNTKDVKSI